MAKNRPRLVVLDGYTLNPGDLSWNKLRALGQLQVYEYSAPEVILERAQKADILLPNKAIISKEIIDQCPDLQCICVTATGYNNVDLAAAKNRGIPVCNVAGYSTYSVAQHVFALLLEMTNAVAAHHSSVEAGEWAASRDFSYHLSTLIELQDKVMGIYGFGRIGQQVARIAQAMGMQVIATHKHPKRDAMPGVRFVALEELFSESDVVSLHAPLNKNNQGIMNADMLNRMKPGAYLINTARGPLIVEKDLKMALESGHLAGAGLDVLSSEPPRKDHPLVGVPNCWITPHNAWASLASRQRMMELIAENVCSFLRGQAKNVVNDL